MRLGRFSKAPIERKLYTIDYSNWLDDAETVTAVIFTVEPSDAGGLDVDSFSILAGEKIVAFYASAGLDRVTYTIEVRITTSIGQVREDQISFAIRDN